MKKVLIFFITLIIGVLLFLPNVKAAKIINFIFPNSNNDYSQNTTSTQPSTRYYYSTNDNSCSKSYYPNIGHDITNNDFGKAKDDYGLCVDPDTAYSMYGTYSGYYYNNNGYKNGIMGEAISDSFKTALGTNSTYSTCQKQTIAYLGMYKQTSDNNFWWFAQTLFNNRSFYSDSSCKNIVVYPSMVNSNSPIVQQATRYCEKFLPTTSISLKVGETYNLDLDKDELDYYSMILGYENDGVISLDENSYTITALKAGTASINLSSGKSNNIVCYDSNDSQDFIIAKDLPHKYEEVTITVVEQENQPGTIRIQKGGYELVSSKDFIEFLEGIKFKFIGKTIKSPNKNVEVYATTDAEGKIIIKYFKLDTNNNIISCNETEIANNECDAFILGSRVYMTELEESFPDGYLLDFRYENWPLTALNITTTDFSTLYNYKEDANPFIIVYKKDVDNNIISTNDATFKIGKASLNDTNCQNVDWDFSASPITATANNGIATFNSLEYGEYCIKETLASENHIINNQVVYVNLVDGSESVTIDFINYSSIFHIEKIDNNSEKPLEGAVFRLTNKSTNTYKDYTTDAEGTIQIINIAEGQYKVEEIKAPTGYENSSFVDEFSISINNPTYIVQVSNTIKNVKTGNLNILIPFIVISIFGFGTYMLLKKRQKFI